MIWGAFITGERGRRHPACLRVRPVFQSDVPGLHLSLNAEPHAPNPKTNPNLMKRKIAKIIKDVKIWAMGAFGEIGETDGRFHGLI